MWHSTNFSSVIRAFSSLDKRKLVALILLVLSTGKLANLAQTHAQIRTCCSFTWLTLLCKGLMCLPSQSVSENTYKQINTK